MARNTEYVYDTIATAAQGGHYYVDIYNVHTEDIKTLVANRYVLWIRDVVESDTNDLLQVLWRICWDI